MLQSNGGNGDSKLGKNTPPSNHVRNIPRGATTPQDEDAIYTRDFDPKIGSRVYTTSAMFDYAPPMRLSVILLVPAFVPFVGFLRPYDL